MMPISTHLAMSGPALQGLADAFVASSPSPTALVTLDGAISVWNAAAARLFGRPAAAVVGAPCGDLAPPGQEPELTRLVEAALRGETSTACETSLRAHDAQVTPVTLTAFPLWGRAGEIVGAALVMQERAPEPEPLQWADAVARAAGGGAQLQDVLGLSDDDLHVPGGRLRIAASDLHRAEQRFHALVTKLPAAVYLHTLDPDAPAVYLSPAFTALTGYTQEVDGLSLDYAGWMTLVHPDDRSLVEDDSDLWEGVPGQYHLEYRFRRADGVYIWVHDIYTPLFHADGQLSAYLGILLDVSANKTAPEATTQVASAVETFGDAVYVRNLDGIVSAWNPAAEQLFGYSSGEAVGRNVYDLLSPHDAITTEADTVTPEEVVGRYDTQARRKDGAVIDIAITLSPILDAAGVMTGITGAVRDISPGLAAQRELREALDAAEAGAQTKAEFLRMLSHELRTPLQAVLGYAEFLLSGRDGELSEDQHEDVHSIFQGARRMAALIEQVLDLSRMEVGQLALRREPVNLQRVLEAVRQDITPQALARGLDLRVLAPALLPDALGDPTRIRQIVLNLAGNAVKFTESGEVSIEARQSADGWLEVLVADTGIGIAPQYLSTIFEEFRQVDSALGRRQNGFGLGLAISRRLAEQMGGDLGVESTPGVGSTFTLRVPVAPA
ncbi:MAG: PAS domain-containing sensor histidine kinase [Thermomicrobiales bacterium]